MLIITVKLVENVFEPEMKDELMAKLTDAVEAVAPGLRDVTFVTVEDVKEGAWSIGGKAINARTVHAHLEKNLQTAKNQQSKT